MTTKSYTPASLLSVCGRWLFLALFLALGSVAAKPAVAQDIDWVVNLNDLGSDPTPAGGLVSYNLTITNAGADDAPATTTTVTIPAGTTLETITGLSGCSTLPIVGPSTATCAVPTLPDSGTAVGVFGLRTTVSGSVVFSASVPTALDMETGNNTSNETTTVTAGANLRQTIASPATAVAGSTISLTLTTTNLGPNAASGMIVDFPIPTGMGGFSTPAGCTLSGSTYLCTVPSPLAANASHNIVFTGQVRAASPSTITPLSGVTPGTPADPITTNNTGTANITVTAGTDMYITKSRSPVAGIVVGDTVTFTLTGRYTGNNPSTVTITDTLPANYTPVSASGTGWTCGFSGQTMTCTRPAGTGSGNDVALPAITLITTAASAGSPTNTATVAAASPADPNLANNSATDGGATIANPTIDLRANKSGPNPPLVVVGNTYTFRLSASNIGTAGFFGTLRLSDALPAGYTITGVTGSGWTCSPAAPITGPATLTCERVYTSGARLAAGATTPDVVVTALATATGTQTNTLTVSSPNPNLPDTNGPNDTTQVTTTGSTGPNSGDVSVAKTALLPSLVVGDVQTFSIEVRNTGPTTSTNVQITDDLINLMNNLVGPTGSGVVGFTTAPGAASGLTCSTSSLSATSRRLSCTIPSLPICVPGVDCPTIEVQVRPGGNAGARSNTVAAFSQNVADADLANNTATVGYTVTPRADVIVDKVASPNPATAGQNLTYVVTATNVANGLSEAANVSIVDALPVGMTFVSASPSAGTCSVQPLTGATTVLGSTVECNLGTIANGAQRTVTIVVRPNNVTRGTTITNEVAVSTTTPETNGGNNTASISTTVQNPLVDLLINKVDSVDPVAIGDDTVYTIVARNNGPSTAENVVVTDTLPASRLRYRAFTASGGGICAPTPAVDSLGSTLACSWTSIPAGETRTVTVTMRGDTKGVGTNVVSISSDESLAGFENNPANNVATQTTTVRTRADMEVVSKIPSADPVNLRETFTYTIRVRNNPGVGLAEADEVMVTDTLPTGMALTGTPTAAIVAGSASSLSCTGTSGSPSFACNLGTVTSGAVVDIVAPVQILTVTAYPQTFTNTAFVTTTSLDVAPGNNDESSSMTINSSSLTGRLFRDFDNDGAIDAVDTGISGITMTLSGTSFDGSAVSRTATTAADGTYTFPFVPQGTYTVTQGTIAEQHLVNGTNTVGSVGGTNSTATTITGISLPANTAATGYLFAKVPTARLGLAKNVQGAISVLADGSVRLTLRHTLRNYSLEPLINVSITDPLNGVTPNKFGTHVSLGAPATDPMAAGTYTVYNATSTCGAGTLNSGFNGSSDTLLASGIARAVGTGSCTIDFILRYQPVVPRPTPASGNLWENQSTMVGTGEWSGQTSATNPQLTDLSHSGTNPDPNNNGIANETGNNTPTPVAPTFGPQIRLVKTADTSALTTPVVAGNTITYSFAVSNTGNVTLANVAVNDPLLGGAVTGSPIATLLPGQTVTLTMPYALTAGDLAARQITNQATATGTHSLNSSNVPQTVSDLSGTATGNDTPTVVNLADIRLVKTVNTSGLSSPVQVGNTLTYGFAVHNTGTATLTNVTVTDPMPGLVLSGNPIASLAGGAVNSTSITGTYTITQADIDRGYVENTALVSGVYGTDAGGNPIVVTDTSGTATNNNTPTRATVPQNPRIDLVKIADTSGFGTPAIPGNPVAYRFEVRNTGNVTLTNVVLADPLPGLVLTAPAIASLAPGAADTTSWTGTLALTQAHIDTGRITNQATATGGYTDATNTPRTVSDLSGTAQGNNTATTTPVPQTASLALTKSVNTAGVTNPALPGQTLAYVFSVRNTGNTTLTNITLADPLPGMNLAAPAITSLAPGATASGVWTGTYAITQANIDAGQVVNQATATGRYTDPVTGLQTRTDPSGATFADDAPTVAPLAQAADIALVKTVDTSGLSTPPQAGDTLSYSFAVSNTGNVTLTSVDLTDPLPGISLTAPTIASLAPGATNSTAWTATYALTQADIDAGFVENQATAEGVYTDPIAGPQNVSDPSGTTTTNDTPTRAADLQAPAIDLVKTVSTTNLSSPAQPGDTLLYSFTVRNTGNTTLTGITLADPLPGMVLTAPTLPILAPGASNNASWSGTYTLTQADIDAGEVINQATAEGAYTDPVTGAETVADDSGTTTGTDTPTRAAIPQVATIALTKTVDTSGLSTPAVVGETLTYAFTVTNTGNTTLTSVDLTDPLPGIVLTAPTIATLAPGASDSASWTATYALTQADIDAGEVVNQATAEGVYTDPITGAQTATDDSGTNATNDTPTRAAVAQDPSIALVKTVDTSGLSTPPQPGDTLAYSFAVTNTGNTTLTSMDLTDPLPGIVLAAPTIASLAPGATNSTAWTATYALTQADIDTGIVENQATAEGAYTDPVTGPQTVEDLSGTTIADDIPTLVDDLQEPSIALVKMADASALSNPGQVGETISYTFSVTNTGNTTLNAVTLFDPLPGLVVSAPSLPSLAPGATNSTSWTATYALTQDDIDAGEVVNQATASGTYTHAITGPGTATDDSGTALGNDTPTTTPVAQGGSIALVKTVDASGVSSPAQVGEQLVYAFTVRNTGNTTLTGVTLTDPLPGIALTAPTIASLAPGATDATSWTGVYTLTQDDIDAGEVVNQATAEGAYTDAGGNPLIADDLSGATFGDDTPTRAVLDQDPSIALVKTVDTSGLSSPAAVGDALTYAFTVTNTGTTTLTNVVLADPLPGIALSAPPIASLAPGATDGASWTATYALTQADIDAGEVINQATATGTYTDPNTGTETTSDLSGTTAGDDTPTRAAIPQVATIALTKTVDTSGLSSPAAVGDTLAYAFTVANTGNTTLTSVDLTDPLPGIVLTAPTIATLAPGASASTWTATYAITQADIDAGEVINQATAEGVYTDPITGAQTATDDSGTNATNDTPTRAAVPQSPSIALVKTVDTSGLSSPAVPGDTLAYAFTVVNTGNTTLTSVDLTDPLPGMILTAPTLPTLAPGASDTTSWSGTYTLTQADIDAGEVINQAIAEGVYTDPVTGAQTTSDDSGTATGNDTPTRAAIPQAASIALVKEVDASGLSSPAVPGDTLSYTFTVTNTGNTTLASVDLADPLPGIVLTAPTLATLAPGATDATSWTATYALTQDDIDAGFVENQATAEGVYTDPITGAQTASDDSGTATDNDTPTVAPIGQAPAITLIKTVDTSGLSVPAQPGDTLAYAFAVRNTGTTTLTDVTLVDSLLGAGLSAPVLPSLAPGQQDTTSWTGTYTLTQADIDAGFVENTATATGGYVDPITGPQSVSDVSGTDAANDTPTRVEDLQDPAIALVKTVDASALSVPAQVGDTLTYAFEVTNTGNTTLTDVALADPLPGIVLAAPTLPTLAPGATDAASWTATYTLTQADIDAGFVENTAVATGTYTDPTTGDRTVSDDSGATVGDDVPTRQPLVQDASLSLVKTVDTGAVSSPANLGETLLYTFTVTNTGNTTLTNLRLEDPMPGLVLSAPNLPSLAPGASDTISWAASYTLTQADLDRGFVENTATARGDWTDGNGVPQEASDGDDARADLVQDAAIDLVKVVDASDVSSPAQVGDTLTYTFEATNTGRVTLRDVTLADPMAGLVLGSTGFGTLAPGQTSAAITGTYALTQADIDAGFVENQAVATGTYTDGGGTDQTTSDDSGTTSGTDTPTRTDLGQNPGISLIKRAFVDRPGGISEIGDTIRYTFEIRNTGNVTLRDVVVEDTLPGIVISGAPIPSLAPGQVDTATYTAVYAVTAADFVRAEVINQATATGSYTTLGGPDSTVSAISGTEATNTDPTVVGIGLPAVDLLIEVDRIDDTNANGRTDEGDRVWYRFTVTNTGNVPLSNTRLLPDTLSLAMPGLVCAPVDLAVGASAVLVCEDAFHTITAADAEAGTIVLSGDAEGTSPGGVVVSASSAAVAVPVSGLAGATPGLTATKTADREEALVGESVRWTITLRHTGAGGLPVDVAIADALPEGFLYREGSARLDGTAVNPTNANGLLVFPTRTLAPGATLVATLDTTVTSAAASGAHTNRAWGQNGGGTRLTNTAEATVRVAMDAVFQCATVVGRVFLDRDHDGVFRATDSENEEGLGGVRLVAPNGVAVTTDAFGRYSLPCEAMPSNLGSSFQLKLDTRTLPQGATLTTENPRVVRLTPGMITRLDFGVDMARPIHIDLDARAFPGGTMRAELDQALAGLAQDIARTPSAIRLVYVLAPGEQERTARAHLRATERALRAHWRGDYALRIDTRIVR